MRKLLLFTFAAATGLLAQAPAPSVLTDQRVYDLVTTGVSAPEIIRIISAAPKVDFDLRPESTDVLMKAGVPEDVLKAMAARENGVQPAGVNLLVPRPAGSGVTPRRLLKDENAAPGFLLVFEITGASLTLAAPIAGFL